MSSNEPPGNCCKVLNKKLSRTCARRAKWRVYTVGCKWAFAVKYKSDRSIERYKARLVAKEFTQSYGIYYQETFAPIAKLNIVRVLLSLVANLNWQLQQLDIKNAFLNGDLEEEVYMELPNGFDQGRKGKFASLENLSMG